MSLRCEEGVGGLGWVVGIKPSASDRVLEVAVAVGLRRGCVLVLSMWMSAGGGGERRGGLGRRG